jgi:hypothetical protein
MQLFGRPKERKTALQTAADELAQSYARFDDLEREQILSLIREIHRQTSSPCFEKVAIAAMAFFKRAAPALASGGNAGDAILLALVGTNLSADLQATLPDFEKAVADARSRLQSP